MVETTFNAVGNAAGDLLSTIGNTIGGWFAAIGLALGGIPFLANLLYWLGDTLSGVLAFVGTIIKTAVNTIGSFVIGVIELVGGALMFNPAMLLEGIMNVMVHGIGGLVVMIVASFIDFLQSLLHIQGFKRPLQQDEIAVLRMVFGKSLALYNIRIIEERGRSGLWALNSMGSGSPRAIAIGNTIYFQGGYKDSSCQKDYGLLVHEATHCWQFQNVGTSYAIRSLIRNQPADYKWEPEIARGAAWKDFRVEPQAQFLQDLYNKGYVASSHPPEKGQFFESNPCYDNHHFKVNGKDYANFAIETVLYIKALTNSGVSQYL